jgi:hypothetical protein
MAAILDETAIAATLSASAAGGSRRRLPAERSLPGG